MVFGILPIARSSSSSEQPAWRCEPLFGPLCPDHGLDALSAADRELARRSGLRVFVYRKVPARFHSGLFQSSRPPEVRSGQICDFMRGPCTPPDPPKNQPGYSQPVNEWLTGAKHAADVPLLAKFLALGSLRGVHTDDPSEAHFFVVPFLGGFVERVSPAMSQHLDREQRQGHGVVERLLDHLPHFNNATASRHVFLLTNSCGGCLRGPCYTCAVWQRVAHSRPAGIELAVTLGPSWPAPKTKRPVAFFHTRSHWHPVTPLGFAATIEWMRKSRFCICPPGDVPYNKRLFTALLAGCVPVIFSFKAQIPGYRNWWKPRKGASQRDMDPFYGMVNYSQLVIEVRADAESDIRGFISRLRAIPDAVVEAKQVAIERVRHLLLYDMSGSHEDAFSCVLKQLLTMLPPPEADGRPAPLSLV